MEEKTETVYESQVSRGKKIVRTSIIGIVTNLVLAGFKALVGLLSNSIAIVLDAVNNLSDALSSVITIVGTILAGRAPDKEHPLGHGRIEYISAMIISAIVLYAGVMSLIESVKKILHPEVADYSAVTLIVVSSAVIVKLILGQYVRRVGMKVRSDSLVASGKDALFDALISLSVLLSAVIFLVFGLSLEAYVGVLISLFIVKAGIDMLRETMDEIVGRRVDRSFTEAIKETVCEDESVGNAYDLFLHSYGPDRYIGSVHVEVPETMTASEIDAMERRIAHNVYAKHGVLMTGIGIYSVNTMDSRIMKIRTDVANIITSHEGVLQIHGFFLDSEKKEINLDIIIDFGIKDRESLFKHISEDLQEAYPDYKFNLVLDIDI